MTQPQGRGASRERKAFPSDTSIVSETEKENHRDDYCRDHAPLADSVDPEELEVGQPRRKNEARPGHSEQNGRYCPRISEPRGGAHEGQHEHRHVPRNSPCSDRHSEERGPLACIDGLARAHAARQLANDAELVQQEVERDEDPGERERRHDHPPGHCAAGFCVAESTIALSTSYGSAPGYFLVPIMNVGV